MDGLPDDDLLVSAVEGPVDHRVDHRVGHAEEEYPDDEARVDLCDVTERVDYEYHLRRASQCKFHYFIMNFMIIFVSDFKNIEYIFHFLKLVISDFLFQLFYCKNVSFQFLS